MYRWSLQHDNSVPELSQDLLHKLQQTYLSQRSYLLRSIEHLLLELVIGEESHQSITAAAITEALDDGLDMHLCESLAASLDPTSQQSLLLKPSRSSSAAADSTASMHEQDSSGQGWLFQQQALMEQEILMQLAISVFELKPCTPPCFAKVMSAIHLHVFCSWHEDAAAGGAKARVAQLVSAAQIRNIISDRFAYIGSCTAHACQCSLPVHLTQLPYPRFVLPAITSRS